MQRRCTAAVPRLWVGAEGDELANDARAIAGGSDVERGIAGVDVMPDRLQKERLRVLTRGAKAHAFYGKLRVPGEMLERGRLARRCDRSQQRHQLRSPRIVASVTLRTHISE
jgi:hypothetical protein